MDAPYPNFTEEDETIVLSDGRAFGLARYGAEAGLPVLALHGAPASRYMFDVADEAARELGITLYCPDRPGYGLTPMDEEPRLRSRVEAMEAIADALRLDRFAVLGISGGGPYAVGLAERLGSRITALGLVSPMGPVADLFETPGTTAEEVKDAIHRGHRWFFLNLPKHPLILKTQAQTASAAFKAAPKMFSRLFAKMLSEADGQVLSQPHVEASIIRMTQESLRQGPIGGLGDMSVFSRPWEVAFDDLKRPVCLWQGTADRIVPAPISFWLASRFQDCSVERIEGAGHFWVYDHVPEVLGRLKTMHEAEAGR